MRTFGKEYEAFYNKVQNESVEFIRYDDDIRVSQKNGTLEVTATDLYTGKNKGFPVDMVILSTGMEPQEDQQKTASIFGVSLSPDRFFLEKHPKLAPVETATDGIFLAGACQGPKDIPDTVAQGSAAAAAALSLIDAGSVTLEPYIAYIDEALCSGCKTCVNTCPYNAIEVIEKENGQVVSRVNDVLCKGCGTCVAACPSGIINQYGFTYSQIIAELEGVLSGILLQEMSS
jgi:heterodisulfide reductase subunit A